MALKYDETKATELAAYFLKKSDGDMFLLKLMKLLYIADRESMRDRARPITFDHYVSMDNGPVLSRTLNIMNGMVQDTGAWATMIAPRNSHKVSIVDNSEVTFDDLSEAELQIADRVYKEYGHIPRFRLADLTHSFAEWQDPHGSSIPIRYEDVLQAVGYQPDEIPFIMQNMKEQQAINEFFEIA